MLVLMLQGGYFKLFWSKRNTCATLQLANVVAAINCVIFSYLFSLSLSLGSIFFSRSKLAGFKQNKIALYGIFGVELYFSSCVSEWTSDPIKGVPTGR